MIKRKIRKTVNVDGVEIGGNSHISIQSMTNTDSRDVVATVFQITRLTKAGCEIVRLAIPDEEAAVALKEIKINSSIPIVADIHFDYRLALKSIESGADKIRINPGNIGSFDKVKLVADAARDKGIPIRIGVNSGSIEKDLLLKYEGPSPSAMVESALRHVNILEKCGFFDIVLSLKSSDVINTIEAYRQISDACDYPLHLGVTEAGTEFRSTVKSSIGIGTLLSEGIGDTIRVSATADPVEEIKIAKSILSALNLIPSGVDIISCPTCGRCMTDVVSIANKVEELTRGLKKNIKVAIMGCAVNGPGEAKEADIGIACGVNEGLLFRKGEIIKKVPAEKIVETLMNEIKGAD
jgi:(E)-4-hydroxy-3-methylbut-2-enyl-diphosphate synthase